MNRHFISGTSAALLFLACTAQAQVPLSTPHIVPFVMAEDAGIRPLINIAVDGVHLRAVVHANASSYLQLNHKQAGEAKLTGISHDGVYGIAKPGTVSTLGRDRGIAKTLKVGDVTDIDIPVDIFEKYSPDGQDIPMLGLKWISAHHIVMSFDSKQMYLDPSPATLAQIADGLLKAGYSRHRMFVDPSDGRYVVQASVSSLTGMMVVGTVARTELDEKFVSQAAITTHRTGSFGGPSGATGTVSESDQPVVLQFDASRTVPVLLDVENIYSYLKTKRPEGAGLARAGELGADFLLANKAVIDFGSGMLYLK